MEDKESMGIPPNSSHNNNNSSGSSTMISMSTGMPQQQSNQNHQNHQQQTQASITPAVPVSIAPPSASSGGAGVVVSPHGHMPTVVTPASHMPTVVTAAAALGARSVTITNNEDKPSSNNNSTNSSNSNNSGGGGFGGAPPSNPTPISAAAGPNTLIHPSSGMNMGMGRGGGVMMTMGMAASGGGGSGGSGGGTPDSLKRKRGRPRKYGPDGSMALALTPLSPQSPYSSLQKRGRGRPPGSGRKQRLAALGEWVLGSAGIGFTPHVITIAAGEDVASKIMSFSQQGPRAVCILSANGAISNVTLRQPATSGGTLTYEGRFEILSLSGSFLLTENGGTRSRTGGLSVSLASPDGRVIGGGVAGMLMAASPVQVVVGSFLSNSQKEFTRSPNPEPSMPMPPTSGGSGGPTNAMPISRASLNDTYGGGPGSPPLNQNSGGAYNNNNNNNSNSNSNQQPMNNLNSYQSMSWSGSQSVREARHNTDINISLPGG